MANNRMYLYCPNCNEAAFMCKRFGGPFDLYYFRVLFVNGFLEAHSFCNPDGGCLTAGGHLELRFESSEDKNKELPEGVKFMEWTLAEEQERPSAS